jgi:hypothetical protein
LDFSLFVFFLFWLVVILYVHLFFNLSHHMTKGGYSYENFSCLTCNWPMAIFPSQLPKSHLRQVHKEFHENLIQVWVGKLIILDCMMRLSSGFWILNGANNLHCLNTKVSCIRAASCLGMSCTISDLHFFVCLW